MKSRTVELAEELNRSCHCVAVDRERLREQLETGAATAGIYSSILRNQPNLFSASPVFLAGAHLERMRAVIAAVEAIVANEGFRRWAFDLAPEIARVDHGPRGAFLGYDFHLGREGPQLIEINTNAGGALLNAALARAQQACCQEFETALAASCDPEALEERFLDMFRREWRRQRGSARLGSIAIVDDAPESQYLYPEFVLFQNLFRGAGFDARIIDPRRLTYEAGALRADGAAIDLVYDRLTDFHLREPFSTALAAAYRAGDVVVTPNPHVYALYADKRHLTVLCDAERLRSWGLPAEIADLLVAAVPETKLVDPSRADDLWRERKGWFFKPLEGYGGKAAYRGDKLTRSTWEAILGQPYVAQRVVPPSQRTILLDGCEVPLKLDVRAYVYAGVVQLVVSRLWHGQTTNFRTQGGGFAPVFTERPALRARRGAGAGPRG
jgi:hypothetical protein